MITPFIILQCRIPFVIIINVKYFSVISLIIIQLLKIWVMYTVVLISNKCGRLNSVQRVEISDCGDFSAGVNSDYL